MFVCLILFHDINTFYFNSGVMFSYSNGERYPQKEIEDDGIRLGSLGTAVIDFMHDHRFDYKLLKYAEESHGGLAIQKVCINGVGFYSTAEKVMEMEKACQD